MSASAFFYKYVQRIALYPVGIDTDACLKLIRPVFFSPLRRQNNDRDHLIVLIFGISVCHKNFPCFLRLYYKRPLKIYIFKGLIILANLIFIISLRTAERDELL